MAKNGKTGPEFKGFLQIELGDGDIAKINEASFSESEHLLFLASIVKDRYRVSMQSNEDSKSVKISMMDVAEERTSYGYMLTAEAPTLIEAVLVLHYKHVAMMDGRWTPFLAQQREVKKFR